MDAVVGKPFEAEALWSAVAELVLPDEPGARAEIATAMAS
jgi:hypothetical protein